MIDYTRSRLVTWGKWCGKPNRKLGYPRSAAFVNANTGDRSAWQGGDMPPEIEEVEEAVNRMSSSLRNVVIWVYTKPGPLWLKAWYLGTSKDTLRRRLRTAEQWIDGQIS